MVRIKSASRLQTGLLVFSLAFLFVIVVCPMFALFSKAFHANDGTFIGLANFVEYFSSPHLVRSLKNSLVISTAVAAVATALAFVYAYALTRALVPAKKLLRFTAVLPLFAPTMMYGIALVYLIGNKGIITMAGAQAAALRTARHLHQRSLLHIPAGLPDTFDNPRILRQPPVRGGARHGHLRMAHLPHRDAARR